MITMDNQYMTVKEVCQLLKVSRLTVYRWIKFKKLPAIKIGKEFRFAKGEIEEFLNTVRTSK